MNAPASLPLAQLLTHAAAAVQAVRGGRNLDTALAACPAAARPGAQALAFHALRWLGGAQAVRAVLVPKAPPAALDALLLTALALLWPGSGPPYAEHTLVDQAVAAARQRGGFVNAVLRRFLREREALLAALASDPAARFNHPRWWVERLQRDWPAQWQAVLEADQQRAPLTLRVNARRGSAEAYVARLAEAGLAAQALPGTQAVVLAQPVPVTQLPGFADGDVSVQDAAAQRAAPLLIGAGLPAGARVLDACAAPGGKTAHLLELADLDVLALDSEAQRLERVHDTLQRLGLRSRTLAADAGDPSAWWDGVPFDAILLDAPCSASGIVRRHPDVRWLRRASDITALARTQARLLDALWPTLKRGGRLLYCTCSVFKAEGQDQIDAFLQRHGDAAPLAEPRSPGHLLPLPDNGDGFFYGLLHKT
ncbi:MAG: 16S rRNA (cytosine(967)-C(5))-methyltransferase RsmB [Piscinibacter sp.]|uniref:16S rRNA (cytosine(967)-C(5))-methyltransferase RsmB n=1 Tax=Piscinibacter sp. TaxID=1903157 RepID=UPI001B768A9D|nr:16S rRNA (cytosine(967)-C(5))-methyltransferase RsmB [Piscinibacter sp.]MBP5989421.1 16S rRNA (cytosine(967)-C(5))-methyltransferase RsmB [Piscinibacter sp.]MBP6027318.1 16S rRNA (cytosine(967)-C(5))-methyltransferase RsmB [Piscinibacter sp.]